MANGVGGFLTGLTEGFAGGSKLAMAMDQNEREKARAIREQQSFDTSQKAAEQTRKLTDLQIADQQRRDEEAVRKTNMQNQIKTDMTAYQAWISGRSDQPPASVSLVLETQKKPGGINVAGPINVNPAELTESQKQLLESSIFQKARIDHKFMDEESFEKQRQLTKTLTKEGVIEAFDLYDKTGDSAKAVKAFNGTGGLKGFKGMELRREINPMTGKPDVMVYGIGADGKTLEKKTSRFEMMLAMMPDKMIEYGVKSMQEDAQNKRTAATNATSVQVSKLNNSGAMDRTLIEAEARKDSKDPDFVKLETLIMDPAKAAMANPQNAMDIQPYMQTQLDTLNVAYKLLKAGKASSHAEAAAMAMREVQEARKRNETK
jgi:hypothetical protein